MADPLEDRDALVKAHFFGGETPLTQVKPSETELENRDLFQKAGAIPPAYPPESLLKMYEHSTALRQNVEAYMVNIDGMGHGFKPVINLNADEATTEIETALLVDKGSLPSAEEVKAKKDELALAIRIQKAKAQAFFTSCCPDSSFVTLRKNIRQDVEVLGAGYMEVLRNAGGEIVQLNYVPAWTVRLLPQDKNVTEVKSKVRHTQLEYGDITQKKRFRRYAQIFNREAIIFKEFGDPRVISPRTGKPYKDVDQMRRIEEQPDMNPATEIFQFRIHSGRTPYGVPRWIGALIDVLGSRQASEVNYMYFQNKSVPPMAVIVSGGRLNEDSVKRIEDYVENRIKGGKNFHKIMVLEGEPAEIGSALDSGVGRMKIQLVPLTMAQHNDALFQKYDERNIDKVGMQFRLPRLLRGDIRDFNRSTADAAIAFAEVQVFAPIRNEFDWTINHHFMPELGLDLIEFKSNSPVTRDPAELVDFIRKLSDSGVLTPEEGRELAEDVFNQPITKLDEVWTKIPAKLILKGILPDSSREELQELFSPSKPESDPDKPSSEQRSEEETELVDKGYKDRKKKRKTPYKTVTRKS